MQQKLMFRRKQDSIGNNNTCFISSTYETTQPTVNPPVALGLSPQKVITSKELLDESHSKQFTFANSDEQVRRRSRQR